MADTKVAQVLKALGWVEVASTATAGFFTASGDCLYAMSATTPSLPYAHRYNEGDAINFEKAAGYKLFFNSDQADSIYVVVTPK